jgi:hypothetical protein
VIGGFLAGVWKLFREEDVDEVLLMNSIYSAPSELEGSLLEDTPGCSQGLFTYGSFRAVFTWNLLHDKNSITGESCWGLFTYGSFRAGWLFALCLRYNLAL